MLEGCRTRAAVSAQDNIVSRSGVIERVESHLLMGHVVEDRHRTQAARADEEPALDRWVDTNGTLVTRRPRVSVGTVRTRACVSVTTRSLYKPRLESVHNRTHPNLRRRPNLRFLSAALKQVQNGCRER